VLSPSLFNHYVSKAPPPPPNIKIISYADDFTIYATGPDTVRLTEQLNNYLPELTSFFTQRNLEISATKSTVTLITPHTAQYNHHPQVEINNQVLPLNHNPKILGPTFDTMFTFTAHHKNIAFKASKRNNILKALSGTTYGKDKETLLQTYKAIGRPIIDYACPAWIPVTSKSNLNRLQTVQNAALRTITGCHNITSEPHLHSECRMLTVQQHSDLLAAQFLVKSHDINNPCHRITTLNQPPRTRKETLHARYHDTIQPVMPAAINSQSIKTACNTLHTSAARTAVETYHAPVLLNG
jgi:hypothetical protein